MLGQTDPLEMLAGMHEATFQMWLQYFAEEPFGPQVENLMMAQCAAAASGGGDPGDYLPMTAPIEVDDVG
jgi:hypothetical protein